MNKEEWKDVAGYVGLYQVSNKGRVRSNARKGIENKVMKPGDNGIGYLYVHLNDGTGPKIHTIHRLVAEAFLPPPSEKLVQIASTYKAHLKNKVPVNHIDGDKSNNNHSNLEWTCSKNNIKHAMGLGIRCTAGTNNPNSKLTEEQVREIRKLYVPHSKQFNQASLATRFNVQPFTIGKIIRREAWSHI